MRYLLLSIFLFSSFSYAKSVGKVIAKIPEASGIAYCIDSDTLIIANDEGYYYEIDREGKILKRTKLGNYDLEGVICDKKEMIFAIENKGILIVEKKRPHKKKIDLDTTYQGKKLPLFNKKAGIEGIAKIDDRLYLSKQSNKKKNSFIAVVQLTSSSAKIIDMIEHSVADTSGLTYHEGYLYLLSDTKDLLVKYDLEKRKKIQKVKLRKGAWEGIAFDDEGFVYLADDDGQVLRYKKKSLGL